MTCQCNKSNERFICLFVLSIIDVAKHNHLNLSQPNSLNSTYQLVSIPQLLERYLTLNIWFINILEFLISSIKDIKPQELLLEPSWLKFYPEKTWWFRPPLHFHCLYSWSLFVQDVNQKLYILGYLLNYFKKGSNLKMPKRFIPKLTKFFTEQHDVSLTYHLRLFKFAKT